MKKLYMATLLCGLTVTAHGEGSLGCGGWPLLTNLEKSTYVQGFQDGMLVEAELQGSKGAKVHEDKDLPFELMSVDKVIGVLDKYCADHENVQLRIYSLLILYKVRLVDGVSREGEEERLKMMRLEAAGKITYPKDK